MTIHNKQGITDCVRLFSQWMPRLLLLLVVNTCTKSLMLNVRRYRQVIQFTSIPFNAYIICAKPLTP